MFFVLLYRFNDTRTHTALAEARDISIHLNPLQKHFTQIEETDFAEAKPLLEPLMHVICMVWSRSRYYCQSSKITVLLRQICNLLIHQVNKPFGRGVCLCAFVLVAYIFIAIHAIHQMCTNH